jgi:hypothetical protein
VGDRSARAAAVLAEAIATAVEAHAGLGYWAAHRSRIAETALAALGDRRAAVEAALAGEPPADAVELLTTYHRIYDERGAEAAARDEVRWLAEQGYSLVKTGDLDAAWRRVEAALPEGLLVSVTRTQRGRYQARSWVSSTLSTATWKERRPSAFSHVGPTPTAALHALADRLDAERGKEGGVVSRLLRWLFRQERERVLALVSIRLILLADEWREELGPEGERFADLLMANWDDMMGHRYG